MMVSQSVDLHTISISYLDWNLSVWYQGHMELPNVV